MSCLDVPVWTCPVCGARTPNWKDMDNCWGTKWVISDDGVKGRSEEKCNYNRKYGLLGPKGEILTGPTFLY